MGEWVNGKWVGRWMGEWMSVWTDGWISGWFTNKVDGDGQVARYVDEWTVQWVNRQKYVVEWVDKRVDGLKGGHMGKWLGG